MSFKNTFNWTQQLIIGYQHRIVWLYQALQHTVYKTRAQFLNDKKVVSMPFKAMFVMHFIKLSQ